MFCAHSNVTPPEPLPLVGDTVSQDPFPDAVQFPPEQPAGEPVTVAPKPPEEDATTAEAGLRKKLVQVWTAAPACVTTKPLPAIVAPPARAEAEVFCAHITVTPPEPLPLVGDTVSQDPFPDADQFPPEHPLGEPVTVAPCAPPLR